MEKSVLGPQYYVFEVDVLKPYQPRAATAVPSKIMSGETTVVRPLAIAAQAPHPMNLEPFLLRGRHHLPRLLPRRASLIP
jgi:hypothetical protein